MHAHLVDDLEAALDREPVEALSRAEVPRELLVAHAPSELLRFAAFEWAVMIACWIGMATLPWWTYAALMPIVAGRLHALGVILHDAGHQPLRGKPPAMRALEILAGFPLLTTLNAMRYHHLRHHRDNGMPSDPYFKAGLEGRPWLYFVQVARGAVLVTFWGTRPIVAVLALASPRMRVAYARVFLQDKSTDDLAASREVLDCAKADLGQIVAQIGLLGLVIVAPGAVVFGWYIPSIVAGLLAAWRLLEEHDYRPATDRRVSTLLATTRDHHLAGPLDRLILAPRNIGHHVVHHLHPQVGLAHLPALRAWWVARHPSYPRGR